MMSASAYTLASAITPTRRPRSGWAQVLPVVGAVLVLIFAFLMVLA